MSVEPKSIFGRKTLAQAHGSMDPADRRKLLTPAEGLLNGTDVFEPLPDPTAPARGALADRALEGFAALYKRTIN